MKNLPKVIKLKIEDKHIKRGKRAKSKSKCASNTCPTTQALLDRFQVVGKRIETGETIAYIGTAQYKLHDALTEQILRFDSKGKFRRGVYKLVRQN